MIDTNQAWGWAQLALPYFVGLTTLLVGVGIAAWIVDILFNLMRKK